MGYYGKLEEKKKALFLRRKGYSYTEILKKITVSKSTLSKWCKDITLSASQVEALRNKKVTGQEKGRLIAAKNKKRKRQEITSEIFKDSLEQVGNLSQRDRLIAGVALYLGDGAKGDQEVNFSNTNPNIIKFMIAWLREFGPVDEADLRGQIWIHDNQNEKKARRFWSNITKIPVNQFRKSYVSKNKVNSNKIRKNINRHGVFSIRISRVNLQRRLKGLMLALLS
ncbi:hypothetical protein KKD61_03045 [Patescibacteria group bacterium]|nr:hypothetical protein [Patescibacteria group bacterium]